MKKIFISALFAASALSGSSALAAGLTSNLEIEATVTGSCTLDFKTPKISFNIAKDNFSGDQQIAYFTTKCGGDKVVYVTLDGGSSGDVENRTLKITGVDGATDTIAYQVYQGTTTAKLWGDKDNTQAYNVSAADVLSGKPQPFLVQIPASSVDSSTATGTYRDTLTATVSYDGVSS